MIKFPQLDIKSPEGEPYHLIGDLPVQTVPQAAQVAYRLGAAKAFEIIQAAVERGDLKAIVELASQANVEDFYL